MIHESLAIALGIAALAGDAPPPGIARTSANDQNLLAMVATPEDMINGAAQSTARSDLAAIAVKALLDGTPKRLIDPVNGVPLMGGSSGKP